MSLTLFENSIMNDLGHITPKHSSYFTSPDIEILSNEVSYTLSSLYPLKVHGADGNLMKMNGLVIDGFCDWLQADV